MAEDLIQYGKWLLAAFGLLFWVVDCMKRGDQLQRDISVRVEEDELVVSLTSEVPVTFLVVILTGFRPRVVFLFKRCDPRSSFSISASRLISSRSERISLLAWSEKKLSFATLPSSNINSPM